RYLLRYPGPERHRLPDGGLRPPGDPEVLLRGELRVPELQFQEHHQTAAADLFGPVGADPPPDILFPGNFQLCPLPLNFEEGFCHRFGNFGALCTVEFTFQSQDRIKSILARWNIGPLPNPSIDYEATAVI